eukprot:Skav227948  [mRNA]  locus=scaffold146:576027:577636:- [translate_table: standard]
MRSITCEEAFEGPGSLINLAKSIFNFTSVSTAVSPSSFCLRWFCDFVTLSMNTAKIRLKRPTVTSIVTNT